jgi:general secretion pathway protein A
VVVAQINQTQVSATEFLQAVLVEFGFTPFQMKKAELLATLNNFLIEQCAAGRKVLLIVDEAQNLGLRVLEEIRMLSGVETTKEKVLRIILAGQPGLNDKLDAPELAQLVQRVRLRFHLATLTPEETREYILHRLEVAGSQGREIFHAGCFEVINRYAGGVPRLINTLCDTAMLAAFNADRDHVLPADVEAAVEELQWVEFAARRAGGEPRLAMRGKAGHPAGQLGDDHSGIPVARLLVVHQGRTVGDYALRVGRIIVGRAPDADVRVDEHAISRHHCLIVTDDRLSVIEDLNSKNGVFHKGERVRLHNLNDGDVISLGSHELMYIDERGI